MPVVPPPDAPTRPSSRTPADANGADGSHPPRHTPTRRRRRRAAAGVVAVLLLGGGGYAAAEVRSAENTAASEAREAGERDLLAAVGDARTDLNDPAREGEAAATELLRAQVAALSGEPSDPDTVEGLLAQLRGAADDLDEAAAAPMPQRPSAVPVAAADPVFARLDTLRDQAGDVAGRFRDTADATAEWNAALTEMTAAAATYAEAAEGLPDSDDPEVVADAWRAERDLLDTYRADLDAVSPPSVGPSLQPLVDAQLVLVDGMSELADDAVAALEAGDVDTYADLLDDRLSGSDRFGVSSALADAREQVGRDLTSSGPLETARAHALGLVTELERLGDEAPDQLSGDA